ncbi:hypothetical protein M413DRAFT_438843 [Hebeloma cylindrosporum]|uniref:Glyoxalase-like domain-containing protein n=1 Tax=Hebeloma cylindrosporum TaxID=76867 RepID=A0A0C3D0S0_HEBCY|nr:hypothetical protein M413DRAFT_438843 [Hebeloma cylindrosporum h7]
MPNTKTLDHIVHLTPPGTVEQTSKQFQELGFRVLPGGIHADGLTENSLVVFADGVYLELISFTHPASHYPPGSPGRIKRDSHPWSSRSPGWIDFAFLGNGSRSESIAHIINQRGREEGSSLRYAVEQDGGRTRRDGQVLKWLISAPPINRRGLLPFFCGDVTSRSLRVPSEPPSNTEHASTARGIAFVRILVEEALYTQVSKELISVVGIPPIPMTPNESFWELDTYYEGVSAPNAAARLFLTTATTEAEVAFLATASEAGSGIYEVGFRVQSKKTEADTTPYGKISWVLG